MDRVEQHSTTSTTPTTSLTTVSAPTTDRDGLMI